MGKVKHSHLELEDYGIRPNRAQVTWATNLTDILIKIETALKRDLKLAISCTEQ